jgi:hypothetical protein
VLGEEASESLRPFLRLIYINSKTLLEQLRKLFPTNQSVIQQHRSHRIWRSNEDKISGRIVYKVAVAYVVVSWLLIQAASILFPTFEAQA